MDPLLSSMGFDKIELGLCCVLKWLLSVRELRYCLRGDILFHHRKLCTMCGSKAGCQDLSLALSFGVVLRNIGDYPSPRKG